MSRVGRVLTPQLELAILEYVGWFNHQRLHSSLGDSPPAEHEFRYAARNPTSSLHNVFARVRALKQMRLQPIARNAPWMSSRRS